MTSFSSSIKLKHSSGIHGNYLLPWYNLRCWNNIKQLIIPRCLHHSFTSLFVQNHRTSPSLKHTHNLFLTFFLYTKLFYASCCFVVICVLRSGPLPSPFPLFISRCMFASFPCSLYVIFLLLCSLHTQGLTSFFHCPRIMYHPIPLYFRFFTHTSARSFSGMHCSCLVCLKVVKHVLQQSCVTKSCGLGRL